MESGKRRKETGSRKRYFATAAGGIMQGRQEKGERLRA